MLLQPASKGTKKIKYGILIVCEDTRSNYFYIQDKVRSLIPQTSSVEFEYANSDDAGGSQTDKLVACGISKIQTLNQAFNNGETDSEEHFFREMYCIGDVDDNEINGQKITKAIQTLETAKTQTPQIQYELLLSNECFEIWYILHFQDITARLYRGTKPQIRTGLIERNKRNTIKSVLKNVTGVSPKEQKKYTEYFTILQSSGNEILAIKRAKVLEKNSLNLDPTQLFPDNPSTQVYKLIERLNSLK